MFIRSYICSQIRRGWRENKIIREKTVATLSSLHYQKSVTVALILMLLNITVRYRTSLLRDRSVISTIVYHTVDDKFTVFEYCLKKTIKIDSETIHCYNKHMRNGL